MSTIDHIMSHIHISVKHLKKYTKSSSISLVFESPFKAIEWTLLTSSTPIQIASAIKATRLSQEFPHTLNHIITHFFHNLQDVHAKEIIQYVIVYFIHFSPFGLQISLNLFLLIHFYKNFKPCSNYSIPIAYLTFKMVMQVKMGKFNLGDFIGTFEMVICYLNRIRYQDKLGAS